ncbi:MAG: hypothetical protein JNL28_15320 [Planctomycetes bacterium]|nr:hypothetical protein [Planctomycetota bacterium]
MTETPPDSTADLPPPAPSRAGTARQFPCSNCGAELTWDPTADELVCAHCDARQPVPRAEAAIVERPLSDVGHAARGFGVESRTARCPSCGAKVSYEGRDTALECAFCGAACVLEESSYRNALRPESLIPLGVGATKVEAEFKKWLGGLWFRPNLLKGTQRFDALGVYMPCWTFDAVVDSQWSADAGFYYTTMELRPVMVNGKMQMRMVPVQRVRWEPAWGRRHDIYDDVLVHASRGVRSGLADKLGRFDLKALVPYRPEYLAGWRAEEYAIDLENGWKDALARIVESQEVRCAADIPGDTNRNLRVHNVVSDVRWKLILLPIWTLTYRFNGKPYNVLIHGQSGRVVGRAPYSFWKIFLFVVLILFCAGVLVLFAAAA